MMTRRAVLWSVVLLLGWTGAGWAQDGELPDFQVPQGMVRRDFPLGLADVAMVEQLCRETLTGEGKFFVFQTSRKVRVIGRPGEVETIRQMLPHLSQPPVNVKIEFTARTMRDESLRGIQVTGGGRGRAGNVVIGGQMGGAPGVFRRGPRGGGAIEIDVLDQASGGSTLSSQFILVQSGREGFIEVAREVPMIDYFTQFVADGRYGAVLGVLPSVSGNPNILVLAGGLFTVPQIRWEKEGARLLVQPVVEGDLVHVTVMPQISAIQIVDPGVFRARGLNHFLSARQQFVTYMELATTVTVQSGQEVTIGGFTKAAPEFNQYFFGGTAVDASSHGAFTLRATIQ